MGVYFVRQPNGLLARFSTFNDSFACFNLTRRIAVEICMMAGTALWQAHDTVQEAYEESRLYRLAGESKPPKEHVETKTVKWHDAIATIRSVHSRGGRAEKMIEEALKADAEGAESGLEFEDFDSEEFCWALNELLARWGVTVSNAEISIKAVEKSEPPKSARERLTDDEEASSEQAKADPAWGDGTYRIRFGQD